LVAANKSLLPFLPTPDAGARAIRVGKAKINKNQATVVVQVTVGGDVQRIVLSMKQSDEQWRVAAISAEREDVETTIDFEQPFNPNVRPPDPAQQWLGQSVAIAGITLDGRRVSLQDYKGKVVLIDFWATWCGPCIKEMPNIYQNYTKYHDAGFEVLAISLDEEMPELQAFLAKENPPWLVLADKHPQNRESMSQKYKIQAIPTLLLVGPDGKVLDVDCRGPKLGARLAQIFGG
jgi:thiol-disulfide isomerase/thioredoxin